jgi:hypothetical protein
MGGLKWRVGDRGDPDDRRFEPPAVRTVADGVDGGDDVLITKVRWPSSNRPGAHSVTFHCDTHLWSVTVEWPGQGAPPRMEVVDTFGLYAILTHPATSGRGKKPVFKAGHKR